MDGYLTRPAWLEINLDNFEHNMKEILNKISSNTKIMSIVKSDGYRLGAIPLAHISRNLGIDYFGVATLSEAIALREEFNDINILTLGYTPEYLFDLAIENNIISSMYSLEEAKKLNNHALSLNKISRIHIAFDSGMSRIGFVNNDESLREIIEIFKLSNIKVEGIFSHFAACDSDPKFTESQFNIFTEFIKKIEELGFKFEYKHIANSSSVLSHREYDLNMVRPGIIQYGLTDNGNPPKNYNLKEVFELKAEISAIRYLKKGETVGYERTYTCKRDTKVVTIPVGYADCYPRILSGKVSVLINGIKCPQIGLICMDQMMIDATNVDCKIGDEVVLLGKQNGNELRVSDICKLSGDCETSFITHFNKRLPKHYFKNNKLVHISDII